VQNTTASSDHIWRDSSKHARSQKSRQRNDRGFTLIELLIVITIVPLIVGALAGGLIEIFSLQTGVSSRLGDSADAQVVSSTFIKDVQSATSISTAQSTLTQCGTGSQLLELEWGDGEVISYSEVQQSGTTYSLVRNDCATGPSATPSDSSVLSYDVLPPCPAADSVATCTALNLQPAPVSYMGTTAYDTSSTTPVTTVGITSIQFPVVEPNSSYSYQLSATPAPGPSTAETNLGLPASGATCGFALPGTGDFANTMCFIGFGSTNDELVKSAYPNANNKCTMTDQNQQGVDMSVNVPGGYIMKFCLTIIPGTYTNSSGDPPVVAVTTPIGGGTCKLVTCDDGHLSNGEGFLGNNNPNPEGTSPFYAGIGCPTSTPVLQSGTVTSSCISPALFQTTYGGTDTVMLSNILVTDPQGNTATGYEIVTADAETIDSTNGAYVQWTSLLPASKPLPFNLIPNFTFSDLGNACNNVPSSDATGAAGYAIDDGDSSVIVGSTQYNGLLTGLGTDQVKCSSTWQTTPSPSFQRTGTAMIGITPPTVGGGAEPVTIQTTLKGEGYNAVAFGLLLP
jgi:prepilin-type N-terminal cleavage/methylation domain-containing protein